MRETVKLTVRYIVLGFIMYLAYVVTGVEWLAVAKGLDSSFASAIVVSVFGALTMVLKYHFETKVTA